METTTENTAPGQASISNALFASVDRLRNFASQILHAHSPSRDGMLAEAKAIEAAIGALREIEAGNLDGESFHEFHNRARQVARKGLHRL